MYAIKQAMLLSGAVPLADITIYYMDIRAFGKGFEEFYQNAKAMGIEFIKGKVARITENPDRSVQLRFEHIDGLGQVEERQHDLVVLSLGMLPGDNPGRLLPIETGDDGFVMLPHAKDAPCHTGVEGVFVAGTATGPKDIVDSIVEAGAAATEAAMYMKQTGITSNKSESRVL
jgi:heterodisulfide reductase subunit A